MILWSKKWCSPNYTTLVPRTQLAVNYKIRTENLENSSLSLRTKKFPGLSNIKKWREGKGLHEKTARREKTRKILGNDAEWKYLDNKMFFLLWISVHRGTREGQTGTAIIRFASRRRFFNPCSLLPSQKYLLTDAFDASETLPSWT